MLEGHGDVFGLYCADFDRSVEPWHHREVTREGVRRAMIQYYQVRGSDEYI